MSRLSGAAAKTSREGNGFHDAVVLATPVTWRRRLNALAIGWLLVQAFVALRVTVAVLYGFSRIGLHDRHLIEAGSFGTSALDLADQILTGDLHVTYIAPLLIGLVVEVRPEATRALRAK